MKMVWQAIRDFLSWVFVSPRLSHQIHVLQMSLEGKEKVIEQLGAKNLELETQYKRLDERLKGIEAEARDQERESFFRLLEPVLVQVTVFAEDLKRGVDLPIEEIIRILETIPEKLRDLGIGQFIRVGEITEFNPNRHVPLVSETGQIKDGDKIVCVVPGFEYKTTILLRAEVRKVGF